MTAARKPLRLLAEDEEDLKVVSAALQDAVTTLGDIAYEKAGGRVTVALSRFCWECSKPEPVWIRAGLQFGGVRAFRFRGLNGEDRGRAVQVLALTFEPSDDAEDPGGAVTVHLAGGGDLRADIECVDVVLADISEPWPAKSTPAHDL